MRRTSCTLTRPDGSPSLLTLLCPSPQEHHSNLHPHRSDCSCTFSLLNQVSHGNFQSVGQTLLDQPERRFFSVDITHKRKSVDDIFHLESRFIFFHLPVSCVSFIVSHKRNFPYFTDVCSWFKMFSSDSISGARPCFTLSVSTCCWGRSFHSSSSDKQNVSGIYKEVIRFRTKSADSCRAWVILHFCFWWDNTSPWSAWWYKKNQGCQWITCMTCSTEVKHSTGFFKGTFLFSWM